MVLVRSMRILHTLCELNISNSFRPIINGRNFRHSHTGYQNYQQKHYHIAAPATARYFSARRVTVSDSRRKAPRRKIFFPILFEIIVRKYDLCLDLHSEPLQTASKYCANAKIYGIYEENLYTIHEYRKQEIFRKMIMNL